MFTEEKYNRAIMYYSDALDSGDIIDSIAFHLRKNRAIAHSKTGNFVWAISDCCEALELNKNDIDMLLLRANCHTFLEQFEKAQEDYERAIKYDELKNDAKKLEEIKTKIVEVKNKAKYKIARTMNSSGEEKMSDNKFDEALEFYSQAVDLWPENILFLSNRAECYMKLDKFKLAVGDYQFICATANISADDFHKMIKCYIFIGNVTKAEKCILESGNFVTKIDGRIISKINDLKILMVKINEFYKKNDFKNTRE